MRLHIEERCTYIGLHYRLQQLYAAADCGCTQDARLAGGDKKQYQSVSKAFEKAAAFLHARKRFSASDLAAAPVMALTDATYQVMRQAIDPQLTHHVPQAMKTALQKGLWVFSGMKTYTQLTEARALLLDDKSEPKPRSRFIEDVRKLNEKYNVHYLEAEHIFATRSAQMADKWMQYQSEGDRYHLQYRTAADDKVRDSHRGMHNITLPVDDPFWSSYFPPNGWRCRCVAVQVRKGKYEISDSGTAADLADKATTEIGKDGKNKLELFRYNPGKARQIMPPNHPYTYAGNCGTTLSEGNDKCKALKEVERQAKQLLQKEKDKEVKEWAKKNIPDVPPFVDAENFDTKRVLITRSAVKSIAAHFADPELKLMAVEIFEIVTKAELINSAPLDAGSHNYELKRKRGITGFRYYRFEWGGKQWRLNTEVIGEDFEKPYSIAEIKKG